MTLSIHEATAGKTATPSELKIRASRSVDQVTDLEKTEHLYKLGGVFKIPAKPCEAHVLEQTLTKRQQTIFNFIRKQIQQDGFGPTIRDIQDEMGFKSPNGVICHLRALENKGLITRQSHKSRSIVLTDEVNEELNGLPLAGRVAAGALMEAVEQQERIDLGEMWNHKSNYVLEVEGDSMIDANIQSGDYVVVRKRYTASKGDIVVARTSEGDATLKYWFPEKNRVRLQPANKKLKPIYSRDAKVMGVVVGVVRNLQGK